MTSKRRTFTKQFKQEAVALAAAEPTATPARTWAITEQGESRIVIELR